MTMKMKNSHTKIIHLQEWLFKKTENVTKDDLDTSTITKRRNYYRCCTLLNDGKVSWYLTFGTVHSSWEQHKIKYR